MKKDPSPSLSFSTQVKKGPPTSCLAVSVSASDEGNWTPFLRRSRYTSFTSLTSTPPGKPCDHVWIQETESFREQRAAKQNTILKVTTKKSETDNYEASSERESYFWMPYTKCTVFAVFFFGGGAVTCFWLCHTAGGIWDPSSLTRDWSRALGSADAGSTLP